ncbi:MAG: acyloxyacyl hydrolase [Candidatus Competibacteraceae bacterium]
MHFNSLKLALMLLGLSLAGLSSADEMMGVGVRGGFSNDAVHYEDFRQYELFINYPLPWSWRWSGGWKLDTRLEGTIGVLNGAGETGFIGSLGPTLVLGAEGSRIFADLGISPTVLSRSSFGRADFGGDFQFTSHIGLYFQISQELELGYRFQHMSNAHLETPNPGLNMHMLELSYRFPF